jgi:sulfatase maturation enzyme AslB (radical SAM superfamily)
MPTLEITTNLGCSLACRFCPQERLARSYPPEQPRSLTLANFEAVLRNVPAHVRIDFSGMAEPWLNPDATAMAAHAFEHRPKVAIYTTLQGMAPADAAMLLHRFGARITLDTPWVIHLPDKDGSMTGWKPSEDYIRALSLFVTFKRERAPPGLTFMTMSRDGSVNEALRLVMRERLDAFTGTSRVENLDRLDFSPGQLQAPIWHAQSVLCAYTPFFDHNVMLPNGDVLLCAMDYSSRHVLGNLLRQSYAELFTGAEMGRVRVRAMGAVGDDEELICRKCQNAVSHERASDVMGRTPREPAWNGRPLR